MKTDHSYFREKVNLRFNCLPNKKRINILECFAGKGLLWDAVSIKTNKQLDITRIEKEKGKGDKPYLVGDNLKFLKILDLSKYDIIDLDAYGIPIAQLEILFNSKYKGIIIITYISSVFGCLPRKLLYSLGYTKLMINKIPTLFYKNPLGKILQYLSSKGVNKVFGYFYEVPSVKNYFYFYKC